VWQTPWAAKCLVVANRFWFCSLVFSVILGCLQLLYGPSKMVKPGKKLFADKGGDKTARDHLKSQAERMREADERQRLKRRLVTDCFDLFIPGHVVGWIRTGPVVVGFASVVSTTLSFKDVWDRVK